MEKIECEILGKEWKLTQEEFEFVKQLLGEPQELSNCCGSEVYPHNANDHTSRCSDCKEGWLAGELEVISKTTLDWKDGDIMTTADWEGNVHQFVLKEMKEPN